MRRYRELLRTRGALKLIAASVAVGVAATMVPVSFVLFARQVTHSFGSASLVLAALTVGRLVFSPRRGRMVDRIGARRTLLWLAPPGTATDIAFIFVGRSHPSVPILVAVAAISGAVSAPVFPVIRGAWAGMLPDGPDRRGGFALMSVVNEVNFFSGPLLAGVLVAVGSPTLAVAVGAALTALGSAALATSGAAATTPAKPVDKTGGRFPALSGAGIRYIVMTSTFFGVTFGLLDVAWPAFAHDHGATATAGLFASLFAVGAGVGGLGYGTLKHERSALSLYPSLCLLAAAGFVPMIAADSTIAMAALAALAGLCFAPVTTVQVAAIDEVVGGAHQAEAFTWVGTVYATGTAAGAALAGQLIVASGTRLAIEAAAGLTAAAALLVTVRREALAPTATPGDPPTAADPIGSAESTT
jgi:MFS family permease